MLLFNKKSTGGSGAAGFHPWHPNFRNTAELPDTKTVRTKFFVNVACVILAMAGLLSWLYTEYTIRTTDQELHGVEDQISRDSKPSREAISQYQKFKAEEKKVADLALFLDGNRMVFSDFVIQIGQTLPEHVVITNIQLRDADVSLEGVVKSAPEMASTIASVYEKQMRDSKEISRLFSSVTLTSLARDSATGFLSFEIILKFKK